MSEFGDTTIKLFGRTITPSFVANRDRSSFSGSASAGDNGKVTSSSSWSSCSSLLGADRVKASTDGKYKDLNIEYGSKDLQISSDINKEPKTTTSETSLSKSLKNNGDQQSEITVAAATSTSQEKAILQKPSKILPCPRCKSTNTKFCYYNNYNVNQPRHFCRNCQRYWTAGGTIRNVPVGAGRRKSKTAACSKHCLQINPMNSSSSVKVLSFGSSNSVVTEVVHVPFQKKLETFDDHSGAITMNETSDSASQEIIKSYQGFLPPQVTFPVPPPPWPYHWTPAIPNANLYPLPFYCGCTVPFLSPPNASPSLGKRSRRSENLIKTEREDKESEGNTLVSKSLRISEPGEAANSYLLSALGTKPEKTNKLSLFNGFETKGKNINSRSETSLAWQANPAALCRSLNFRETM